jgi:hypothetical protein
LVKGVAHGFLDHLGRQKANTALVHLHLTDHMLAGRRWALPMNPGNDVMPFKRVL